MNYIEHNKNLPNILNYNAGPYSIVLEPSNSCICIKPLNKCWGDKLNKELVKTIKKAWELNEDQIIEKDFIEIKYNLKNLNKFLVTKIILIK